MISLYAHQKEGVEFLVKRPSAGLFFVMGTGKSRTALVAAQQLFSEKKIDRLLVLCPASVRYAWRTEIDKLEADGLLFVPCIYDTKKQIMYGAKRSSESTILPVAVLSYSLLPQKRHVETLVKWCSDGRTALVCDESSWLKSRTAKQTKGAKQIGECCSYRWLLTGTPIANSPLDLYGQSLVMSNGNGPLKGFKNYWHFQARYAILNTMNLGPRKTFNRVIGYQNLDELTARFAPYVLRRTKQECLDLPPKTYEVREVTLTPETWKIYQELKREAMLCLPETDEHPVPNAAVRIMRLCQLTSGFAGQVISGDDPEVMENQGKDVSSEKLDWVVEEILNGELANEQAIVIWTRWRRERIRLQEMFATKIEVYRIFGGQQERNRSAELGLFASSTKRRILIAQQHAGGFGLNLTAASTAVYMSNSFSYTDRIQIEDRCHRIGQTNPVLYIDVVAVGPNGQRTVDHHVLDCLRNKRSVAEETCSGWRKILS